MVWIDNCCLPGDTLDKFIKYLKIVGLRINNKSSILKTSDPRIWLIKNKDAAVHDINLTIE